MSELNRHVSEKDTLYNTYGSYSSSNYTRESNKNYSSLSPEKRERDKIRSAEVLYLLATRDLSYL